jgi:hypothetical protein
METKELEKSTRHWPALLGDGWLDRFFNTPLDEYFSLSRMVSDLAVQVGRGFLCRVQKSSRLYL